MLLRSVCESFVFEPAVVCARTARGVPSRRAPVRLTGVGDSARDSDGSCHGGTFGCLIVQGVILPLNVGRQGPLVRANQN